MLEFSSVVLPALSLYHCILHTVVSHDIKGTQLVDGARKDEVQCTMVPWLESVLRVPFSTFTMLVRWQKAHPGCKTCSINPQQFSDRELSPTSSCL